MKKIIFILAIAILSAPAINAQKYFTKIGHLRFFSDTKMEDIQGDNHKVNFVLDAASGQIQIAALVKAFEFEKALMQEHFNENYMESDTYPKATFTGKVENMAAINLKKDGTYTSKVSGELTMHGTTNKVSVDATFKVAGGKISCETKFLVVPEDYKITIPGTVRDNIASKIEVTANATLEELKK